jgi:hypothetical protein
MSCEEKTRLAAEYEAATGKFAGAVTELRRRIGISLEEESGGSTGPRTRRG